MKWLRALAPIAAALLLVWLVSGAGTFMQPAAPQLIQVLDLAPRDVEVGDTLAIVGSGFPAGKPARVTFRGVLHRPGMKALGGAEIVAAGTVVGSDQVRVAFGEAAEALFCGDGGRALHTTFVGDVEVAFAAAAQGAAPVAGVLPGVTLDVHPSAGAVDVDGDRDGERALTLMGLHAAAVAPAGAGLLVDAVDPGSRAEAAGISSGDMLTSFDGLRVASAGDVLPAPGAREAAVGVRHAGSPAEVVHAVSVDGFRRASAAELLPPAMMALGALVVVVLFAGFARPPLGAAVQRLVARVRTRVGHATPGRGWRWSRLGRALTAVAGDALPPAGAAALVDTAAWALLAAMPFGQYLVAARLDVGIMLVAAATALAGAILIASGPGWRGLRASLHVLWQHVPAAIAVASVVVTTGSLRVQEIERAQGGWPWDWLALRDPAALVALLLLLACGRIEPDGAEQPRGVVALVDAPEGGPRGRTVAGAPWVDAACRAHRIVLAGLASALFLGGWLLPGLSPAQQDAFPALQLAGAAWFLAKTWGLVVLLAWARWAQSRRRLAEGTRAAAFRLLPLAMASLAATAAWTWWSPARAAQLLVSGSLAAVVALGAVALLYRIRHGLSSREADGQLSPFI